jgi:hypothetical protein
MSSCHCEQVTVATLLLLLLAVTLVPHVIVRMLPWYPIQLQYSLSRRVQLPRYHLWGGRRTQRQHDG